MDRTAEEGPDEWSSARADTHDSPSGEWRSALVDVTGRSPAELAALAGGDSALAHALRSLAAELDEPGEPIAGFNSAL